MTLGAYIRERREALGLSQQEAASKAGLSTTSWSIWERDERLPRMGLLRDIAETIGADISEMVRLAVSHE